MGLFSKKFTIVVVCKANITRSAYLHGYMTNYLKKNMPYARKKVRILSAGVQAKEGGSAHQVVRHVAKIHGFSLNGHRSSPLTHKTVKRADVILVMEKHQKEAILARHPEAKEKIFRLTEYLWHDEPCLIEDIPDPTGMDTMDYEEFIGAAHAEVERIFRELSREDII
jgi:protein-tyrosine-phosphatase